MKHCLKKSIRHILLTAILCMCFFMSTSAAYATTYSVDISSYDAFRSQVNGNAYDIDGLYGAQCWDGAALLWQQLGRTLVTGNGKASGTWDNRTTNAGDDFDLVTSIGDVKRGDVVVFSAGNYGHIAFADEDYSGSGYLKIFGQNQNGVGAFTTINMSVSSFRGAFRYKEWAEIVGKEMETGYERALPDGDYLITSALASDKNAFYFMDINGMASPAESKTNVELCGPLTAKPNPQDIWTITYSDGFYTIKQRGTNMSLDIEAGSRKNAANLQVYTSNGTSAQKFAISRNEGGKGYRIQVKVSGFSLDVKNGSCSDGANIRQYVGNDTSAQAWHFIPYEPEQPIQDGRYVLLSKKDSGYEMDVDGDSADIPNNTKVQVWDDSCVSRYNSFDVKALDNGYYSLTLAATGQALGLNNVTGGSGTGLVVSTADGSTAQQWAIRKIGDAYVLILRRTGMAADIHTGNAANGNIVKQYWYHAEDNQLWYFVPAEYTVNYDLNGGTGAVYSQTKYYKEALTLTSTKPTRSGAEFLGWSISKKATTAEYKAGAIYSTDKDITLYAVWKMTSGWVQEGGKWYYYGTNGQKVTGWKQISGTWYYFNASGVMQTGWKQLSKKWYYFGSDGAMQTGWKQISKKWYYFGSDGVMQTGWKQISKKWYYFNTSGVMQTGWQKISGSWYYFKSGVMVTGWQKISGSWYYFSDGAMVTGTKNIGGTVYQFDSDGVCLNP